MKGTISILLATTGAILVIALIVATVLQSSSAMTQPAAPVSLFDGQKIVDLTYAFNHETPYWPGEQYTPFELKTIATLEKDGVLSKAISLPEHLGTHLDAPNHFEVNPVSLEKIRPEDLIGPGIVIDIALKAEQDADALLTLADIRDWEAEHGPVPEQAIVFLHTGWGRFWTNYPRYKNQDAGGKLHFPSFSPDAANYLIVERKAKGIGIDTLSIDPGISRDFAVHHLVNQAGRYGLENVAHLDQLPATGFHVVVAPMKIENGSGGPTRIFAFVPQQPPAPQ